MSAVIAITGVRLDRMRFSACKGVVVRRGKPVARLVAFEPRGERRPDVLKGKVTIPDSFFDPLPDEELKSWEGE